LTARDAALALLEQGLNRYLALDPDALERLRPLHAKVILWQVLGLGVELYLVPSAQGIQVLGAFEGEPDCIISGTPLDLARLGRKQDSADQLFSGAVRIQGDAETAHRFGKILADLDIDWEEQLSGITGDVLAHQVGSGARRARRWVAELTGTTLPSNLREFLQEEVRLLPTRWEADEFADAVDQVRDTAERLAARLKRLREHLSEGDRNRA
jgi:ubiquinone biosynthesis protein UbiJ